MTLSRPTTYSRSDVTAMLSALPFEEKKWTLNYLVNILVVSPESKAKATKKKIDFFAEFRGLPADNTPDNVIREQMYAEKYGL